MTSTDFQKILLNKIKGQLNDQYPLVDAITEILHISKDSAYRRMRGDTELSFDEAVLLARHFRISLSTVADHTDGSAVFTRQSFIKSIDDYQKYMERSLEQLHFIQQQKQHTLFYLAKDIPVFYHYAFPELAAFKMLVWLKSVYGIDKLNDKDYNLEMIPRDLIKLGKKQWDVYSRINSVEIWNDTTVSSLLNQIEYYYEAGLLSCKEEALLLCEQSLALMKIIHKQALNNQKVHSTNAEALNSATYNMYFHEILIMDNHLLAEYGDNYLMYFVPYAGVNYLTTSDPDLTGDMRIYLEKQVKKSALISNVSEKDQNRFFMRIKSRIEQLKEKITRTDPFI